MESSAPITLRTGEQRWQTMDPVYNEAGDLTGYMHVKDGFRWIEIVSPEMRRQFQRDDINHAIYNVALVLHEALATCTVPWVPFARIWGSVLHREETTREALDLLVQQGRAVHNRRLDHYRIKGAKNGKAN